MPVKSKSQLRFLFAAEDRGELPEGTARKWVSHTKKPLSKLPERLKKAVEAAPELLTTVGADIASGPTTGVAPTEFKPKAMPDVSFLSAGSKPGFGMQFTSTRPSTGKLLKPTSGPVTKLPNLEKAAAALPEVATPVVGMGSLAPAAPAISSTTPTPTVPTKPSKPSMKTSPGLEKAAAGLIGGIMTPEQSPMSMEPPKATAPATPAAPKLSESSTPVTPKPTTSNPFTADPVGRGTDIPLDFGKVENKLPDAADTRGNSVPMSAEATSIYNNPADHRSPFKHWFKSRTEPATLDANGMPVRKNPWDWYELSDEGKALVQSPGFPKELTTPEEQLRAIWNRPSEQLSWSLKKSPTGTDPSVYTTTGKTEGRNNDVSKPFMLQDSLPLTGERGEAFLKAPWGGDQAGGFYDWRSGKGQMRQRLREDVGAPIDAHPVDETIAGVIPYAGLHAKSLGRLTKASIPAAKSVTATALDPMGGLVAAAGRLPGMWGKVLGNAADAVTAVPRALTGAGLSGGVLRGNLAGRRLAANLAGAGVGQVLGLSESPTTSLARLAVDEPGVASAKQYLQQTYSEPMLRGLRPLRKPVEAVVDAYRKSDSLSDFASKGYEAARPHVMDLVHGIDASVTKPVAFDANGNPLPRPAVLDPAEVDRVHRERVSANALPTLPADFRDNLARASAGGDMASLAKLNRQLADVVTKNPAAAPLEPLVQISPTDLPIPETPEIKVLQDRANQGDQGAAAQLSEARTKSFIDRIDAPETAPAAALGGAILPVVNKPGPAAQFKELTDKQQTLAAQITTEADPGKKQQLEQELAAMTPKLQEMQRMVNDRAVQHYERDVIVPVRKDVESLAKDIEAFRQRATTGAITSEDLKTLQSMQQRAQDGYFKLTRFSIAKAQSEGVAPKDLEQAATVATFLKDLGAREPAVDANGQPLTATFVNPETKQEVSAPIMIPATPLGKAVDEATKAQIRAEAAKQGVSIPDSKIAAATGMMDPMTKMLLYGGAALTAVAAINGLMGGGSTLTTILGLLGIGGVAAGLLSDESVRSNPARLFEGGYWKQLFGLGGNAAAGAAGGETPSVGAAAALAGGLSVPGTTGTPMSPPAAGPVSGTGAPGAPAAGATGTAPVATADASAVTSKYLGLNSKQQQALSAAIQDPKRNPLNIDTKLALVRAFRTKLNDPNLPRVLAQIPVQFRKDFVKGLQDNRTKLSAPLIGPVSASDVDHMINAVNASLAQ